MSSKRNRPYDISTLLDEEAAEIDDDASDLFDDDEEEDDFIEDGTYSSLRRAAVVPLLPPDDDIDLESLAARFRKRSRRDSDEDQSASEAPIELWMMYSARGRENENATRINENVIRLKNATRPKDGIRGSCSAFAVKTLPGRFYIIADSALHVSKACSGQHGLVGARIYHVPSAECSTVIGLRDGGDISSQQLQPGDWVIVRRGVYRGDIGLIRDAGTGDALTIMVVPRIPLAASKSGERAKQALFNAKHISEYYENEHIERIAENNFKFRQHIYLNGLRVMTVPGLHAVRKAEPRFEEVALFAQAGCDLGDLETGEPLLRRGDRIRIVSGTYTGLAGEVFSLDDDTVSVGDICGLSGERQGGIVVIARVEVCRVLKAGDHVRVRVGPLDGHTGMIVTVEEDALTLLLASGDFAPENRVRPTWVETYEPDLLIANPYTRSRPAASDSGSDPYAGLLVLVRNDKFAKGYYGYVLDSHPTKGSAHIARDGTTNINVVQLVHLISVKTVTCLDESHPLSEEERKYYSDVFRERGLIARSTSRRRQTTPPLVDKTASTSESTARSDDELRPGSQHEIDFDFTQEGGIWLFRPAIQAHFVTHRIHVRHDGRIGLTTREGQGGNHTRCMQGHDRCRFALDINDGHKVAHALIYIREIAPRHPQKKNSLALIFTGPVEENIGKIVLVLGFPRGEEKMALVCIHSDRRRSWTEPLRYLTVVEVAT